MSDPRQLPLDGVRVLEWTEGIPGPTAGWLLAECGADVVKVERPEGDRLRESLGFHVLNRGKRGAVIDLEDSQGCEAFRRLAGEADVVIVDEVEGGLDHAGLGYDTTRWPSLVWCSTPMFPRDPAWAGLPPHDALAEAAGGVSAMQWAYGKTPVYFVTPMVSYATGFAAALGIVAALRARAVTGRGQRVETSGLCAAMLLQSGTFVRGAGHEGSLATQANDPRGVFPTYGLYETADGWMFVGALTESFWTSLATLLDRADLLADPDLPQNPLAMGRPGVRERVRGELEPIFRSQTTSEWLRRFDHADVPGGRVQSRREALDEATAILTGVVVELDDPRTGPMRQAGAPALFAGTAPRAPGPAPEKGTFRFFATEVPAKRGRAMKNLNVPFSAPLSGIRVLDLTSFIAGPLCPMLLADLGADVVKVEAAAGDPFRVATFAFEGWNRGKRSLVLDLKSDAGAEAFLRLVARADVVVENFRPGVMSRFGLGYETLRNVNPRLIYTAISGFGAEGPEVGRPGFDPIMQARSGFCRAQGGDGEPVLHQVAYTDYMTGTLAAFATTAALHDREQSGEGRRVDLSLYRTSFAMQAAEIVECAGRMPPAPGGRDLLGRSPVYRAYATRDGWIFIAASEPGEVSALVSLLGAAASGDACPQTEAPDGPTAQRIAAAIARESSASALARLADAGVPATRCLTFADVFESAALRRAGLIRDLDHPRLGTITGTGSFLSFTDTPAVEPRPAPALGEDGEEVLREAGFTRAEIDALIAAGATTRSTCAAT